MITEAEYQTLLRNQREAAGEVIPASEPKPRGMNKWESQFAAHLASLPAVTWWAFEPFRVRLADGAWYKPDFAAMRMGQLTFYEVKGLWREAARVRIKVAADRCPFPFVAVTKAKNGEWQYEQIRGMFR